MTVLLISLGYLIASIGLGVVVGKALHRLNKQPLDSAK